jgi:hypothetical protein
MLVGDGIRPGGGGGKQHNPLEERHAIFRVVAEFKRKTGHSVRLAEVVQRSVEPPRWCVRSITFEVNSKFQRYLSAPFWLVQEQRRSKSESGHKECNITNQTRQQHTAKSKGRSTGGDCSRLYLNFGTSTTSVDLGRPGPGVSAGAH